MVSYLFQLGLENMQGEDGEGDGEVYDGPEEE